MADMWLGYAIDGCRCRVDLIYSIGVAYVGFSGSIGGRIQFAPTWDCKLCKAVYMFIALLVPLASLLWGITNYIDKYLISKITKNGDYKGLIVFSSLIAGLILLPVPLITTKLDVGIDWKSFVFVFLGTTAYIVGLIFYFKALNRDDTSLVIAMYQPAPVFGYFLGLIFL